jgi:gamma-glutamyltranspeptidase/glutathione hydrolase
MILRRVVLCAALLAIGAAPAAAATPPAARARHAMIAGPEPIAVEEGLKVLRDGGNALDAAVTMAFVLAVTYPQAGNIGGGGFMLVQPPAAAPWFVDYRETAPGAATRDMFLDETGDLVPGLSVETHRAAAVPGTVAGLALALEKGGTIAWRRALAPALRLARDGFVIPRGLEEKLREHRDRLARHPSTVGIFFREGEPLKEGDRLTQRDLARTLEIVSREGSRGFYRGEVARRLGEAMTRHGGLVTGQDLASYQAALREPVRGRYRGLTIVSAPPPSAGGLALIQTLGMLEPFDVRGLGQNSSASVHLISEALRRAFADRSRWLGDPDFVPVPIAGLLSPRYIATRLAGFDPGRATPSAEVAPGKPEDGEGAETTHFSVLDASGMAVACTTTLNEMFGSGAVADGLGFLLNDEMDDFSARPGAPDLYGLVGSEANSIAPRKRMLSSMSPTIVLSAEGRPSMILGSPGGPVIITAVLEVLLDVIDFRMELQAAVSAPRFHHQWIPDRIELDQGGFPLDVQQALRARGHEVIERSPRGDVQAILVDEPGGWIRGASDPRRYGVAKGY